MQNPCVSPPTIRIVYVAHVHFQTSTYNFALRFIFWKKLWAWSWLWNDSFGAFLRRITVLPLFTLPFCFRIILVNPGFVSSYHLFENLYLGHFRSNHRNSQYICFYSSVIHSSKSFETIFVHSFRIFKSSFKILSSLNTIVTYSKFFCNHSSNSTVCLHQIVNMLNVLIDTWYWRAPRVIDALPSFLEPVHPFIHIIIRFYASWQSHYTPFSTFEEFPGRFWQILWEI